MWAAVALLAPATGRMVQADANEPGHNHPDSGVAP
jgi:hypothetical protein